jgi:hypothetical protein
LLTHRYNFISKPRSTLFNSDKEWVSVGLACFHCPLRGSEPSPLIIPINSEKAENLSIFITPRFFREEPAKKTLSAPWTRRVIYVTCRMIMFKPRWGKVTFTARNAEVKKTHDVY